VRVLLSTQVESYGLRELRGAFFILRSTGKQMARKQEKAPKSCQECKNWASVRKRLRVGEVLSAVIAKMEKNLEAADFKASLADYLRLIQMQKEIGDDEPKEIKVTWVKPDEPSSDQ
jgi:hypothetical protein